FASVAYRGASAGTEWANDTWTEYNPNLFKYTAGLPTRKAVADNFLSGNGVSDLNTIAIYPNPAVDKTKISFFMDYATTDAALSVLDMSGNLIFVQNSNLFAGENNVDMNTTNLEPGTYIVRVSANGTTAKTAKLNVIR
ncbi:MAG: T9SS type A sorting domain-containing protein, partial [Opitutaceae bacterium]|nr:T9SS type A sorting domain-containing protein [Cytophagales bacterium]